MPKRDINTQLIKGLDDLLATARLMKDQATTMENYCCQAKAAMGEVSTSSIKKDHSAKLVADALARSAARRRRS